jgi:hypothetical protein
MTGDEEQCQTEEHEGEEPTDDQSCITKEGEEDDMVKSYDATDGQDDVEELKSVLASDTEDLVEDISVHNIHGTNEMDMQVEELEDDNDNETKEIVASSGETVIGDGCQDETEAPLETSAKDEKGAAIENQGNSADDEAEDEDSDNQEEQETDEGEIVELVSTETNEDKEGNQVAEAKASWTLDSLVKVSAESESGAYADIEESDVSEVNAGDSDSVVKIP